jgi:imidazolonepropionase-like amidohydrolase
VQTPLGTLEGIPGPLTLQCARIVNGEGGQSASPAWITIADGRIVAVGAGTAPLGAVDLGDAIVGPGFVDVQVNGTGAVDFASAPVEQIVAAVDALAVRPVRRSCSACTWKARSWGARRARTRSRC